MFRNSAYVYDLIYQAAGKDYAAEAREVDDQIRARCPGARSLLDVACGTGGHLRHLRGFYDVAVGVDVDPSMVAEARQHLPESDIEEADMRSLCLRRRFDAVVCLFSSIGYMSSTAELDEAIRAMASHLNPAGVLIVDGWIRPEEWIDPGVIHTEVAEADGIKVARVGRSFRDGGHAHLEMHHLVATLDGVDHFVDHHVLTLFSDSDYRAALQAAAFGSRSLPHRCRAATATSASRPRSEPPRRRDAPTSTGVRAQPTGEDEKSAFEARRPAPAVWCRPPWNDGAMTRADLMIPRRVEKPWGYEIWWAVTDEYVGKLLHVNRGHRLSLQYHERKDETSYLLSGRLLLVQGESLDSLADAEVHPGQAWRNPPGVIHTIEALEDSDVLEASTPFLDDVIRLKDDYGREGTSRV